MFYEVFGGSIVLDVSNLVTSSRFAVMVLSTGGRALLETKPKKIATEVLISLVM